MGTRRTWTLAVPAASSVAWCVIACGAHAAGMLAMLPVFLLLGLLLLLRRYPGEAAVARRIAAARPRRRRGPRGSPAPARRRVPLTVPSGGLLMGLRLAVRPPPGAPARA